MGLSLPSLLLAIIVTAIPSNAQGDTYGNDNGTPSHSDDHSVSRSENITIAIVMSIITFLVFLCCCGFLLNKYFKFNICGCRFEESEPANNENQAVILEQERRDSLPNTESLIQIQIENSPEPENSPRNLPIIERALTGYSPNIKEYSISQQKICSICLGDFIIGEYLTKTKCDHLFHINCLNEWLKKKENLTCPVCRKNIVKNNKL